jgi:hypothetical protein
MAALNPYDDIDCHLINAKNFLYELVHLIQNSEGDQTDPKDALVSLADAVDEKIDAVTKILREKRAIQQEAA